MSVLTFCLGEMYWGKYLVVFGFFNNTLLAA